MVEQRYIDYWRSQRHDHEAQVQRWQQEAWAVVQQVKTVLVSQFGATKIIVFGSLVRGRFNADSDIDMAVAGIPKADFFAALAVVNQISQRWIDLKPLESLEPHFRARVLSTGQVLDAEC
ncbi:MAG: nucleotidyltransferase domain-containing protein [Cyanobacteria bacterium J06635_15]